MQELVLFNTKEILVGGRPVFIKEWFDSNTLSIRDLMNSNGQLLSFQEFNNKYECMQYDFSNHTKHKQWQQELIHRLTFDPGLAQSAFEQLGPGIHNPLIQVTRGVFYSTPLRRVA